MVWLDQGDAFFRGFYLKHNVGRYSDTFEATAAVRSTTWSRCR
jgi:hypothetical protein